MVAQALVDAKDPLALDEIVGSLPPDISNGDRPWLKYEVQSILDGDPTSFLRLEGKYALHGPIRQRLRSRILNHLKAQGFSFREDGTLAPPDFSSKNDLRLFHAPAVASKYEKNRRFLERNESTLLEEFADGDDVDVDQFDPFFTLIEPNTHSSDLFRYATLLWSIPVSNGFGRRVRFLVRDKSNGKLDGIFALGDPVFNLRCRDNWVGWDHRERAERLYNVMDIFVLGAVPPYNALLCGKLIALVAASNETRELIKHRYEKKRTIIQGRLKDASLSLLTTASALGKSSVYDRISFEGRRLYQPVGYTEGWGHFHLNQGMFREMKDYLVCVRPDLAHSHRFGKGPNWKIRIARECLKVLDLPEDMLRHGIRRQVFGIPLARNFAEYLRGESNDLDPYDLPLDLLVRYFKARWMKPRSLRMPDFADLKRRGVSDTIHRQGTAWNRVRPKGYVDG